MLDHGPRSAARGVPCSAMTNGLLAYYLARTAGPSAGRRRPGLARGRADPRRAPGPNPRPQRPDSADRTQRPEGNGAAIVDAVGNVYDSAEAVRRYCHDTRVAFSRSAPRSSSPANQRRRGRLCVLPVKAIDARLEVLKLDLPYHGSD